MFVLLLVAGITWNRRYFEVGQQFSERKNHIVNSKTVGLVVEA